MAMRAIVLAPTWRLFRIRSLSIALIYRKKKQLKPRFGLCKRGHIEYELARCNTPDCYLFSLARELLPKRDALVKTLRENGFNPTVPEGGYFVVADWTKLAKKIDLSTEKDKYKDYQFTKKFAKEAGVLAIPPTAFYSEAHKHLGENYARFCFIKKDENLALTDKLMREWNAKKK